MCFYGTKLFDEWNIRHGYIEKKSIICQNQSYLIFVIPKQSPFLLSTASS